jgi:hypothetical protein
MSARCERRCDFIVGLEYKGQRKTSEKPAKCE